MNHHLTRTLLTIIVTFLLVGCGSSSTTTIPPTHTLPPPTHTLPPDTPTLEPTPTETPVPPGTFKGCIYFEGELVDGEFKIVGGSNQYSHENSTIQVGSSGCATKRLAPGYYEVNASYWKGTCATMSGCWADLVSIEIEPNGLIEMDFETVQVCDE